MLAQFSEGAGGPILATDYRLTEWDSPWEWRCPLWSAHTSRLSDLYHRIFGEPNPGSEPYSL